MKLQFSGTCLASNPPRMPVDSEGLDWLCQFLGENNEANLLDLHHLHSRKPSISRVFSLSLHPWRLTWNPKMEVWKMIFLFNWQVIFRFHVNFPGRVPFEQLLGGFCCANVLDDPWCFWLATGRMNLLKLGEKNRPLKRNRCIFSPFQREHQEGVPLMIQKTHLE